MKKNEHQIRITDGFSKEQRFELLRQEVIYHWLEKIQDAAKREIHVKLAEIRPAMMSAAEAGKNEIEMEELIKVTIDIKRVE